MASGRAGQQVEIGPVIDIGGVFPNRLNIELESPEVMVADPVRAFIEPGLRHAAKNRGKLMGLAGFRAVYHLDQLNGNIGMRRGIVDVKPGI